MDAVYPEPWSRLHRRQVRKQMHRESGGRYRTQPVTFAEIKEVDEENIEESPMTEPSAGAASKSEQDINSKFEEFWRAGRERAKEKKLRRARETRRSESDAVITQTCTTTTSTIVPAPSITISHPHSTRPSL
ncbi:hypothetical protein L798_06043 [Zootermopsis nevadensis]|uniref:Uncharacterized protein n=1 Tax=Zootermopsis nevadensis TaxID=136037 RepID=A0A067RIX7_ZOONE|nr:hypothetical protein L798_06043 [Zootermopsis nevadensis]